MLWPKNANLRGSDEPSAAWIWSARSAMFVTQGSAARSSRPGYCTASTSIPGASGADQGWK